MQKKYQYWTLAAWLLLLVTGCVQDNQAQKSVFRMNLEEGLKTLDPAFAKDQRTIWMTTQLFNGLVAFDSSLNVIPDIAHKWEISPDGKTYTFYLRQDVFFHKDAVFGKDSTRYVTAQDVAYSFTRICDKKVASSGASLFQDRVVGLTEFDEGKMNYISGFHCVNDSVFQIQLLQPFPFFLSLLAMPYAFIVPQEAITHYGKSFAAHPIGTGPFQFYKWEEGSYLILHKNPHYFEKHNGQQLPLIEGVFVQFIPSRLSAFVALKQDKLDFLNDLDNSFKDEILMPSGEIRPQYADVFRFYRYPQLITNYLGINQSDSLMRAKKSPLRDKTIRQALNYGIDKQGFVRYMLNNVGYAADVGFVANCAKGFDSTKVKGAKYDPDKAAALVNAYKQKNGISGPLSITLYATNLKAFVAEFIQKECEKMGIALKVEIMQPAALREEAKKGKLEMWQANWIGDYPDAETFLSLGYSKFIPPNGPNTSRFQSAAYDHLYETAIATPDASQRYLIYNKMENILNEELPYIPLYYGSVFRISQKRIHGLAGNPMNGLVLKYVTIDNENK